MNGEETLSPKNRVKFLCSHGGKIMLRPPDGQLKYVGGDTRVIAVPRDINFSELMEKINGLFEGDMVLKYQLIPDKLDVLVSVKCDEDLRHMIDEYDRHDAKSSENGGMSLLRAFLFPSNPEVIDKQNVAHTSMGAHLLEQRYIDAINGVVFVSTPNISQSKIKCTSSNTSHPTIFSISSPCTSPDSNVLDGYHEPLAANSCQGSFTRKVTRVRSSPSLCSLAHQHYQPSQQCQQQQHPPQPPSYHSSRVQGSHMAGNGRLGSALPMGRNDFGRSQMGRNSNWHYSPTRCCRGSGGCINHGCVEDYGACKSGGIDVVDCLPQTLMKQTWE